MSNTLLIKEVQAMTSKSPLTQMQAAAVCTSNKFFIIPKKSTGMYLIFDVIKKHAFFEGMSIDEGLEKIVNDNPNATDLEAKLSELLENNEKYIYDINAATKKSVKGFLGKKTLTVRHGKSWGSITPKSKQDGKEMASFYNF